MPFFQLNKLQKNQLFELVQAKGLDSARFKWSEIHREFITLAALRCEGENGEMFYFAFDFSDGEFSAVMRPIIDGCEWLQTSAWTGVMSAFARWLSIVKAEWELPDLWNSPFARPSKSEQPDFRDEAPFTDPERKQVRALLEDIQKRVTALPDIGSERIAKIEQAVKYLEKKLDEHTSKTDWKNIFVGTVFHIFVAPWLAPFTDEFKIVVTQAITPYLASLLRGLALN